MSKSPHRSPSEPDPETPLTTQLQADVISSQNLRDPLSAQEQTGLNVLSPEQQAALLKRAQTEPSGCDWVAIRLLIGVMQRRTLSERLEQIGLSLSNPTLRQNAPGQPINLTEPAGEAVLTLRPSSMLRPEHQRQLTRQLGTLNLKDAREDELVLTGQGLHEVLTWGQHTTIGARELLALLGRATERREEPALELTLTSTQLDQLSLPNAGGPEAEAALLKLAELSGTACPDPRACLKRAAEHVIDLQFSSAQLPR